MLKLCSELALFILTGFEVLIQEWKMSAEGRKSDNCPKCKARVGSTTYVEDTVLNNIINTLTVDPDLVEVRLLAMQGSMLENMPKDLYTFNSKMLIEDVAKVIGKQIGIDQRRIKFQVLGTTVSLNPSVRSLRDNEWAPVKGSSPLEMVYFFD